MTDNGEKKPSFLDSLASKIAMGPPKKPVGLVKQTTSEAARVDAARDALEQSEDVQKKLGSIMKDATPQQPKE